MYRCCWGSYLYWVLPQHWSTVNQSFGKPPGVFKSVEGKCETTKIQFVILYSFHIYLLMEICWDDFYKFYLWTVCILGSSQVREDERRIEERIINAI